MKPYNKKLLGALGVITMLCIASMVITFHNCGNYIQITSVEWIEGQMEETFIPLLSTMKGEEEDNWLIRQVVSITPIFSSLNNTIIETATADVYTYEMIKMAEANDENLVNEEGELVYEANVPMEETLHTEDTTTIDLAPLYDVDTLLGTYYTVDSTTAVDTSLFNLDTLLETDMTIADEVDGPQILIYHTHSQEAFIDSILGDSSTTVVGVGAYLTELLNDTYGIETLHHTGVYDLIDGQLDRSAAYELAYDGIMPILEANPSIEVVIDLHRDGINESSHLSTVIDGKETAQIMFFNGMSSTSTSGAISYLPNPYIQENLAFSFQMKLAAEELYPGFTRKNYLKSYRYNMHVMPKTLLIEAGAQTNTVAEMMNAMELLAEILNEVLVG